MKMRSTAIMQVAKLSYIFISIFYFDLGLFLIIKPDVSLELLGIITGISLIAFGIIKMIGYFSKDLYRLAFQYDFEFGILLFILGLVVLLKPIDMFIYLFIGIGFVMVADSLFKIRISKDAREFGVKQWWIILILAIVTALVGITMIFKPGSSIRLLTMLLGAALCIEGILNICVAVYTVKIVKNQYPDIIDSDYE